MFAPLQLKGFFEWKKYINDENEVSVRRFTFAKDTIIVVLCILSSLLLGYALSLIPGQQLFYLDAFTNCINLFGVILMIRRYEEAFFLWLINNIIDIVIWILVLMREGEGAFMMFISSAGFLLINLYGIKNWHEKASSNSNSEPNPPKAG